MLQIVGTVQGLEGRNGGWTAVAILEQGNEYPKKLSTKKPDIIQAAMSMMGQVVTAAYNESESTSINPHSGMPYVNRFLEGITLGAQQIVATPVAQQAFNAPQQTFAAPPPGQSIGNTGGSAERELNINRQSARRDAVEMLQHLEPSERTMSSVVRMAEEFVQYAMKGVPWQVAPIAAPAAAPAPAAEPPVHPDDDIPF